jgi:large subunit ribosomal protein L25
VGENRLRVELRQGTGKGVARKLRAAGRIPAVLYGRGKPSTALALDPRELERLLAASETGINTLIDLEIAGAHDREERVVLVKELQREPVRGAPLHVDLLQVDLASAVEVAVPIQLVGVPEGVSLHEGILDHSLRELQISCLPRAIPEAIRVDVSALRIGDSIHVRDLPLPEGVILRSDPDLSVASVVAARVLEEEVPAEAAAEVAPEAAAAEGAAAPSAEEKAGDEA